MRRSKIFSLMYLVLAFLPLILTAFPAQAADVASLIKTGDEAWIARDDASQMSRALEAYEKALSMEPDNYQTLWRLARAHEWQGKMTKKDRIPVLEKGKAYAERAIKANERGVEGHYWLGSIIGRIGEARGVLNSLFMVKPMKAEMDRAAELDPGFASAHYVLSLLYWKVPGKPLSIGDKARALEEAKTAVKLAPENTQYRLGLGEACLALKDRAGAKREFQAVLAMSPTPDDPAQSSLDKRDAQGYLTDLK